MKFRREVNAAGTGVNIEPLRLSSFACKTFNPKEKPHQKVYS